MRSHEHRAVGDAASDGAMVNLGGESPGDAFWLTFGDVVALSGDYFRPGAAQTMREPTSLFGLARIPGIGGTRPESRDELVCALKVATIDEATADARFEPGGRFGHFAFSPRADRSDVERAVRDRYLALAAVNDDHFVAPGPSDVATGSGFTSAPEAYRHLHREALDRAWELGRDGGDLSTAEAYEAAAQHYLTDAFAAGHLRTPVAAIRRYWKARHPQFWERLKRRVASDTAKKLRELSWPLRLVPAGYVERRTLSELEGRTGRYPELSVGDLVARCLHDWDNRHGLELEDGGRLFGDGYVREGATWQRTLAAARAGIDDIEVAFGLGKSGRSLNGAALYDEVRRTTGARGEAFVPETKIPRLSENNAPQNWQARDAAALWDTPLGGTARTTLGGAVSAMLDPDGQFIRQLDALGQGLSGSHGMFALPLVGAWLSRRCCQAFHDGFVEPLARDPASVLLGLAGPG